MRRLDAHLRRDGLWIACVDGLRSNEPANQPGDEVRDEPRNDYAWWRDRPDRGSGRGSIPDEDRGMVGRAYARDGGYPVRGFWEWSR